MSEDKTIYKVKDIAEILGCGINRAYDIVRKDTFPKIKIGRRFYIPKDGLERWMEAYTYKEFHV